MPSVVGWKIYYGDNTTFSSKQGGWEDAPSDNVQLVNIYFDDGFVFVWHQLDYYSLEQQPDGTHLFKGYYLEDEDGPEFAAKKHLSKLGKSVDNATWAKIWNRAASEVDWSKA